MKIEIEGTEIELSECPAHKVRGLASVAKALRSKEVANSAEIFACAHQDDEDRNGEYNLRELIGGTLTWKNGETHRKRRKLLNQLVRPDALHALREEVILPTAVPLLGKLAQGPDSNGNHHIDLIEYTERVFLHMTAKLIGLVDCDSDERMARLRECAFPLFAAVSSGFLTERTMINDMARKAKKIYVEEFYRPSRDAYARLLQAVEDGDMAEEDLPNCLFRLIMTGADPAYLDEEQAIRESILLFAVSVGTSSQSVTAAVDDLHKWVAEHPEEAHRLEDPVFLVNALEEGIRLRPSSAPFLTRVTTGELELPEGPVEPGRELHVMVREANRDPEVFGANADEFDPLRTLPPGVSRYGLGFGSGAHQCFGLRIVLGNDGTGGAHLQVLKLLIDAGAQPDPERPFTYLERNVARIDTAGDPDFLIGKISDYPAILTKWDPEHPPAIAGGATPADVGSEN